MNDEKHAANNQYPLEWLDSIITVTLNPSKTNVEAVTNEQAVWIATMLEQEITQLKSLLKNRVFGLTNKNNIKLLIRHYHSTLIVLLDQAIENGKHSVFNRTDLKVAYLQVVSCLEELLSFIEVRFSIYLSMDERVPATYLSLSREELRIKLKELKRNLIPSVGEKYLLDMVTGCLYQFASRTNDPVTFRDILYYKELLTELERLEESDCISIQYTLIEEMLISINFNNRAFINYFTQKTADRINMQKNLKDKIDLLSMYQKEFKQLTPELDMCFNHRQPDLQTVLSNWFRQELFYLEKKMHLDIMPMSGRSDNDQQKNRKTIYKILCTLSEDQLSIIFKAADDQKIIVSRSLSAIFNMVVPYLSTTYKENLSADSMRSHTYSIEERDKKIVIETLEQMIEKIRRY
ncbi:MAG: hypothetical protein GZ094_18405 [Mariniphaga sp.]|nr:hypothetical protein [Mariniphaga sp.]